MEYVKNQENPFLVSKNAWFYSAHPAPKWPSFELKLPSNLTSGLKVVEIERKTNELFKNTLRRCFKHLVGNKILIIVQQINEKIINAIEQCRGPRPIVLDFDISMEPGIPDNHELEKWLSDFDRDYVQDVIANSEIVDGFEWPSVLVISRAKPRPFTLGNLTMRAISRLVWWKCDLMDDFIKQNPIAVESNSGSSKTLKFAAEGEKLMLEPFSRPTSPPGNLAALIELMSLKFDEPLPKTPQVQYGRDFEEIRDWT